MLRFLFFYCFLLSVLLTQTFCSFLAHCRSLILKDFQRLSFAPAVRLTPSDSVREVRRASEDSFFPFSIFCFGCPLCFFRILAFCLLFLFLRRCSLCSSILSFRPGNCFFYISLCRYSRCRLFGSSFLHSGFYIPALHAFLFCALLIP